MTDPPFGASSVLLQAALRAFGAGLLAAGDEHPVRGQAVVFERLPSGKSTLAAALAEHLVQRGFRTDVSWSRLAGERSALDRIAGPIRRVLPGSGSIADPEAVIPPVERDPDVDYARRPRGGPVSRGWVVVVALVNARTFRRVARSRRDGRAVVCDRWLCDSLIDLRLRYGRHRLAETILRVPAPRPDLALWLHLDATTAARRKPGDQSRMILAEMERSYVLQAHRDGLLALDAKLEPAEVAHRARRLVDLVVARG
ncbi:MAG: nucleoside/nucleotide kinase family protein [Solirubrobacteraceae bacterium]